MQSAAGPLLGVVHAPGGGRLQCGETASLREDYLNQVQRDFLSRRRALRGANTPSEAEILADQSKTGVSTPSTLCSFGLVVVYCSSTRFSGKTIGLAPKAASAASWKPERMSFFLPG